MRSFLVAFTFLVARSVGQAKSYVVCESDDYVHKATDRLNEMVNLAEDTAFWRRKGLLAPFTVSAPAILQDTFKSNRSLYTACVTVSGQDVK